MTTIATTAADSWSISVGSGWITLMLIGMGFCFVFMLGSMWLMRDGRGWPMCSGWWRQQTPRQNRLANRRPDSTISPESEGPR